MRICPGRRATEGGLRRLVPCNVQAAQILAPKQLRRQKYSGSSLAARRVPAAIKERRPFNSQGTPSWLDPAWSPPHETAPAGIPTSLHGDHSLQVDGGDMACTQLKEAHRRDSVREMESAAAHLAPAKCTGKDGQSTPTGSLRRIEVQGRRHTPPWS